MPGQESLARRADKPTAPIVKLELGLTNDLDEPSATGPGGSGQAQTNGPHLLRCGPYGRTRSVRFDSGGADACRFQISRGLHLDHPGADKSRRIADDSACRRGLLPAWGRRCCSGREDPRRRVRLCCWLPTGIRLGSEDPGRWTGVGLEVRGGDQPGSEQRRHQHPRQRFLCAHNCVLPQASLGSVITGAARRRYSARSPGPARRCWLPQ